MKAKALLLAAGLCGAIQASAEVRLTRSVDGPRLAVEPVMHGVWTPRASVDAYTVNPDGDRLGDGAPAQVTAAGRLVAAWRRPSSDTIVVLQAQDPLASTEIEIPAGGGAGTPIVRRLFNGSLITWQGSGSVLVAFVIDGSVVAPTEAVHGRLLGLFETPESLCLVAIDDTDTSLVVATIPRLYEPHPFPIPTTRAPIVRAFSAPPLAFAAPWTPCVEERSDSVLLAWQSDRGEVGRIVLDATGIHGASEFRRGPNGSCQALLNAAGR